MTFITLWVAGSLNNTSHTHTPTAAATTATEPTEDSEDGILYNVYTTFNLEGDEAGDNRRSSNIMFKSKEFLNLVILILIILMSVIALITEYKKWLGCRSGLSQFEDNHDKSYNSSHPRS